jgi:hypothetical protein
MTDKLCILFFGQFRYNKFLVDKIYDNLISKNNCDVFMHFWDYDCDNVDAEFKIKKEDLNYFIDLIKPKDYSIEMQKSFNWKEFYPGLDAQTIKQIEEHCGITNKISDLIPGDKDIQNEVIAILRYLSQFYSKFKVKNIKDAYNKNINIYKCILLVRIDSLWDKPIEFKNFNINSNTYYSDIGGWLDYNFYGTHETIDKICNLYIHIPEIQKNIRGIPWNAPNYLESSDEANRKDISNGPEYIYDLFKKRMNINSSQSHYSLLGRGGLWNTIHNK